VVEVLCEEDEEVVGDKQQEEGADLLANRERLELEVEGGVVVDVVKIQNHQPKNSWTLN
jgi:hypothetical protein